MGEDAVNDDSTVPDMWALESDPSGQAAILLVESLIHGLVAKSVLSVPEAVEIIDIAVDVRSDARLRVGESRATLRKSLAMLDRIADSLRQDMPDSES